MKLKIMEQCNARFIDITNSIAPFDIESAKFIVWKAYSIMPNDSITLVVVDPGVGTDRQEILIKIDNRYFIGPNNGVFDYIIDGNVDIYKIDNQTFTNVSNTFHGRDIFAILTSEIINRRNFNKHIERIQLHKKGFPKPLIYNDRISGVILYIDIFDNAITNISRKHFETVETGLIKSNGNSIKFLQTYGYSNKDTFIAVYNSSNLLEISSNKNVVSQNYNIGDEVIVWRCK